jgi:hypothetical protein
MLRTREGRRGEGRREEGRGRGVEGRGDGRILRGKSE